MSEIKLWMECNEVEWWWDKIVFKSKQNTNLFAEVNAQVSDASLVVVSKIRNLVVFNQMISMQTRVNSIAKICFHYLRNITRICLLLLESIVVKILTSRCDVKAGFCIVPLTCLTKLYRLAIYLVKMNMWHPWCIFIGLQ